VIDLWGKQLPCNQFLSDREFFNHSKRLYIMHPADKIVVIGSALAFMALAFIMWTT
jgi:hypothetical protein